MCVYVRACVRVCVCACVHVSKHLCVQQEKKEKSVNTGLRAMAMTMRKERKQTMAGVACCIAMACALGLAWKAAPNLLGSFSRVARYWRLWTSVTQYALEETPRGMLYVQRRKGLRRLGMRISIEATAASGISLGRQVSPRPFSPIEVYFQHSAPRTIDHHEAYFGCPVHFGADKDAMLLSHQSLAEPNILGDEGITRFLDSHLDQELAQIDDAPSLQKQTKSEIARALSEGLPKMGDIARQMGLSARSFHRRLAEHGLSFQTLTEETRREIATAMLHEDRYALSEISFLTGYSEQSAFNRAFKRWMGVTPATYRKSLR